MKKLNLNINRALSAPWAEVNRDKLFKILGLFAIVFGPVLVAAFSASGGISGYNQFDPYYSGLHNPSPTTDFNSGYFQLVMLYTIVVSIPAMVYMYGYQVNFLRNVLNEKFELPELDTSHFKSGLRVLGYGILLGLIMIGILALAALAVALIMGIVSLSINTVGAVGAMLGVIFGILGAVAVFAFYIAIAMYGASSYYIFAKTDNITGSVSLRKSYYFIKRYWKRLILGGLIVIGISILISSFTSFLMSLPYIGVIIYFVVTFYYGFVSVFIMGDIFRDLEVPGNNGFMQDKSETSTEARNSKDISSDNSKEVANSEMENFNKEANK